MTDGGSVGSTASDCGFWCLVTSRRFAEAVSSLAKPRDVVLRPKEEQDMVGFGWREILGLKQKSSGNDELAAETHQVYYVTNRVCEREDEKMGKVYGKHMDSGLHVGVVDVDCPNGKPQVKAEGQLVTSMDSEAFKQRLREQVARDENKAVLVYVHGCFTDFSRGMGYGAFMQRGLDFNGPMVVYSWPTVGRPSVSVGLGVISLYRQDEITCMQAAPDLREPSVSVGLGVIGLYRQDEVTCMQAAPDLRDLLQMLSTEVGAKAVHVMAYSMGARTLLEALRLSSLFHASTGVTSHIYFMAPDVATFSSVIQKFSQVPRSPVSSVPPIPQDLLQMLSTEVGAKAVHVMAYSMGARTLLEALRLSSASPPHLDPFHASTGVTSHVYFMAPDVSAQSFSSVIRRFKFPGIKWEGETEGNERLSGIAWKGEEEESERHAGGAVETGAEEGGTGSGALDASPLLTLLQQAQQVKASPVVLPLPAVPSSPSSPQSPSSSHSSYSPSSPPSSAAPSHAPSSAASSAPSSAPSSAAPSAAPSSAPSYRPSSTYDLDARSHDSMIERIADVWNVAGESTSGWVTLRQAWQEVREKGLMEVWNEIFHPPGLAEPGGHASAEAVSSLVGGGPERFGGASEPVFRTREAGGNEAEHKSGSSRTGSASNAFDGPRKHSLNGLQMSEAVQEAAARTGGACPDSSCAFNEGECETGRSPAVRENAHIHLFTARNDIALLLSEFMDAGIPKVRAGRGSDDFLLCCGHKAFDTVDVSLLNSGLLSTGHFYLFHHIVRRDMRRQMLGLAGGGGGIDSSPLTWACP
ncbi:unnamed protein product [Closterium sp. Naga37s-1]|nr:unnamed protein product [Closterium sp. Naga37s-1]